MPLVDLHAVVGHVEGHIRSVEEVVREELLDHIPLVAAANHEVVDPMGRVHLEDVPEDGTSTDLDHRLWLEMGLLGNPSSIPAR